MAQSRSRSEPPNWLPEQDSRIRHYAIPAPASRSACQRSSYRTNVNCWKCLSKSCLHCSEQTTTLAEELLASFVLRLDSFPHLIYHRWIIVPIVIYKCR